MRIQAVILAALLQRVLSGVVSRQANTTSSLSYHNATTIPDAASTNASSTVLEGTGVVTPTSTSAAITATSLANDTDLTLNPPVNTTSTANYTNTTLECIPFEGVSYCVTPTTEIASNASQQICYAHESEIICNVATFYQANPTQPLSLDSIHTCVRYRPWQPALCGYTTTYIDANGSISDGPDDSIQYCTLYNGTAEYNTTVASYNVTLNATIVLDVSLGNFTLICSADPHTKLSTISTSPLPAITQAQLGSTVTQSAENPVQQSESPQISASPTPINSNAASPSVGANLPPASAGANMPSASCGVTPLSGDAPSGTSVDNGGNMPTLTLGHGPAIIPQPTYYLYDVDKCSLPDAEKYPVKKWPQTGISGATGTDAIEQEPNIALWGALMMDAWLDDLFTNCPAALHTYETLNTSSRVGFAEVLGRLMFGTTANEAAAPICNNFRCTWSSGTGWSRGDMFLSDSKPIIHENATVEFAQKYRRWYAMQALGNIWDRQKAIGEAVTVAKSVVVEQVPAFLNAWTVPPKSPLGDILNIVQGLAQFIPAAGQGFSAAIAAVRSGVSGGVQAPPAVAEYLEDPDQLWDVVKAVKLAGAGAAEIISKGFKASDAVRTLSGQSAGTPEKWVPQIPVELANLQKDLGDAFGELSIQVNKMADAALNGDPAGPNGYWTLVKGGLYSGWAASHDVIDGNSLQAMLPGYTAWVEDKVLQAIMRGVFFIRKEFSDMISCNAAAPTIYGRPWIGSYCFPSGSKWISLTPYASQVGLHERADWDHDEDYAKIDQLHQIWPHMTEANIKDNLRGRISAAFNTNISTIYSGLEQCYQATNADLFSGKRGVDVFTMLKLWPDETPGEIGTSPLDNTCHWNVPVVDLDQPYSQNWCAKDYAGYNFRAGRPQNQYCTKDLPCCPVSETREVDRTMTCIRYRYASTCDGHPKQREYTAPGAGLFFAREVSYPTRSCQGTNLNCGAYE